jgi:hypothetical protein
MTPSWLPYIVIPFTDTITLTNSPLAVREILAQTSWRLKIDLTGFQYYRVNLNVQTAGAANSDVHFEGSLDGTAWLDLDASGVTEIALSPTGAKDTGWKLLRSAYRVNSVFIRMMEKDGDGVLDPILRQILLSFK